MLPQSWHASKFREVQAQRLCRRSIDSLSPNKYARTEMNKEIGNDESKSRGANGLAAVSPLALAIRIKVVKEIISGTHTAELFAQSLESQMGRHEGCCLMRQEVERKVRIR